MTPVVLQAGWLLRIQGDREVVIDLLNHPSSALVSTGDLVLKSGNKIVGDAHYTAVGNFRIETFTAMPGNLFSNLGRCF